MSRARSRAVQAISRNFARGYLRPDSHLQEGVKFGLALQTQPISACKIGAFKKCIGRAVMKAGYAQKDEALSLVVPAIESVVFQKAKLDRPGTPKNTVIEKITILDPPAGQEAEKILISVKFLHPPPGKPHSGEYYGTLSEFRRHCIVRTGLIMSLKRAA